MTPYYIYKQKVLKKGKGKIEREEEKKGKEEKRGKEKKKRKGEVLDCVQTGYKLNEKVIRHAKVVVAQ